MVNTNIVISLLQDSEIDEVVNFYNLIYGENRTKEKFIWEFYEAPAGKAIYVVARDINAQKIVGTQSAIPIELITEQGIVILTAKSEDTLVHPDYWGQNIFENMYQLLFEKCREYGIKYLWGFTSARKPFLKLGFSIPFNHSQSLMVINIFSSYRYLSKLNSKNSFISLFKILSLCFVSRIISLKKNFISTKLIDKKFAYSIYDKSEIKDNSLVPIRNSNGFWIKQDLAFLKWRIATNPYHEKIFNIYFSSSTDIVANLIFNYHAHGVWYLIFDQYSDTLTENERKMILKKTIKLLLERHLVKLIRTWDFSHNAFVKHEIKIRKQEGFVHLDRGISFVWKSLDADDPLNATDFNLSRIATQGTI